MGMERERKESCMLHEGWCYKIFDNVVDIVDCKHRTPEYVAEGVPVISPGSISWGPLKLDTKKKVSEDDYFDLMNHCVVEFGDIVLSRNQSVGIGSYIDSASPFVLGQDTVLIKPKECCNSYAYQYLQSNLFRKQIQSLSGGSTFSRINLKDLRKFKFIAPPLSEQKKISRILSTWDKAIKTVEKLIANSENQKKALMQQLLTGKKRLPGFSGKWRYESFGELYKIANDKKKQVKAKDYLGVGKYPIVDQGQQLVAAFTDSANLYTDLPVIVFGDHTRNIKWVNFPFAPGADGTQLLKSRDKMKLKFAYYALLQKKLPNLGYSRHMRELKEKEFYYPTDINEQISIAKVLSCIDRKIEACVRDKGSLEKQKRSLMQQLLTGKRRVKIDDTDNENA